MSELKTDIERNCLDAAISRLESLIKGNAGDDRLYYLLGCAYRKAGNWQMAINNYLEAMEINPDSPAGEAKDMLVSILEFYNKDIYNQ